MPNESLTRSGTVALIVQTDPTTHQTKLVDQISDDREIEAVEKAITGGDPAVLEKIYVARAKQIEEEEKFGDYVEDLITQPFVRQEIREHGVQWLKSKLRIEQFRQNEEDASRVIAGFAFQVFLENQELRDFLLAGPSAQVRIRVFVLPPVKSASQVA